MKLSQKQINVDLFDEIKRLKKLLKSLNEWRYTSEVQGAFNFCALRFGNTNKEFQDKWYPLLKELDKEFPVDKGKS